MSSLDSMLLTEYEKITYRIQDINAEIEMLPVGSLQKKTISGRVYSYLQHREGTKVKSKYIPKKEAEELSLQISKRNALEDERDMLSKDQKRIEKALGKLIYELPIFTGYKPVKNIDYDEYSLFISTIAHDLKRMGKELFISEYSTRKYKGINGRYLKGALNLLNGELGSQRNTPYLVLDSYTYQMYFKYKDKAALEESLKNAIPQFLRQGLLVTEFQEAVDGAFS